MVMEVARLNNVEDASFSFQSRSLSVSFRKPNTAFGAPGLVQQQ